MKRNALFFLVFLLGLCACYYETPPDFPEGEVIGYKPVYGDSLLAYSIQSDSPRELRHPGKIYTYNNLLLINELNEGVHVIDNANPKDPVPLYFISIPGNVDIAMKGNVIYADNYDDLVLIRVKADGIEDVKRIQNALETVSFDVPPANGYFECVDKSKGFVVGWEKTTLRSPECYH